MRYEFSCTRCDEIKEFYISITKGPPKFIKCSKCKIKMVHNFGTNFILQGEGWAGKDLSSKQYNLDKETEKTDAMLAKESRGERIKKEVMKVRSQGRAASEQFKRDHSDKWNDFVDVLKTEAKAKTVKKDNPL